MGNTIFVKVKDTLSATTGGILLPDQAKERPTEGVVVAAGPGKLHPHTGIRITNPIPEGVSVLYGKFDGRPVEYKGEECQMIRDDDVLLYYEGVTLKYETATPVRDWVLIALESKFGAEPLQTKSGVVIAAQVMKDAVPCEGVVAKVGEGRMAANGQLTPSPVQPGDVVKFKDYAGNDVMIEGKPYSVVKMVDILCTVNQDSVEQLDQAEKE
jgi:chaperonin GroES